jgi:peroxiredoxin
MPSRARAPRQRGVGLCAAVVLFMAASDLRADDPPAPVTTPAPPANVLYLTDGSLAGGELAESAAEGRISWLSAGFTGPFVFPVERVSSIHWAPPAELPKPVGDLAFELAEGDLVYGSLLALDQERATIEVPRVGRLEIARASLRRIYRWRGSDLVYLGPNGLAGWREALPPRPAPVQIVVNGARGAQVVTRQAPAPQKGWREESGQLVTEQAGASIQGDFGLPAKAAIEFELSWKAKPDFVFALGVSDQETSVKRAFRFEAWGGDLVIERELENEADLSVVCELRPGPGRAHLQTYLDQNEGRVLVFSPQGKQLATLKVGSGKLPALSGLYLGNLRGDLRLEWLRISRWSGELPREVKLDESRIHKADGSIVYGRVAQFDAAAKEFLVKGQAGESRVGLDAFSSVFLAQSSDEKPRTLRVVYQDGTRFSGQLMKVEKDALFLSVPGINEPIKLPVAGLRSLVVMLHGEDKPLPKAESTGRLEIDGARLPGRLADSKTASGGACLVWQPLASETASGIKPGVSGRIVYKEPPPPQPQNNANARNQRMMMMNMQAQNAQQGAAGMVLRFANALAESPKPKDDRRCLYLVDGDVIPSTVTGIDADGVYFKTPLSKSTFVPHQKVQAIELVTDEPDANTVHLTKSKRDRMLTVPRMQRSDPPTHLVRSRNGDYLRGRVIKMTDKLLELESRLETKSLPRERVSHIIWLHPDGLDPNKKADKPAAQPAGIRVQAQRNDGIRLTFQAQEFAGNVLMGKSDVLGACQVAIEQMDQLLIGSSIEKAAEQLAYHQWKLKNAPDPKYVTASAEGDGSEGAGDSGTESPLVGKAAPDFELDLVGGKKFHLADSKGKEVVVLDFWATWCGPCLQAMPQVERAAQAFKEKGVRLVAVNLQETADKVKALLDRQKFDVTVALDRDGSVAEKYKAMAIPQTVIVNRDGTVARLFVGGGPHFEDKLKDALKAVVEGEKPKDKEQAKPEAK